MAFAKAKELSVSNDSLIRHFSALRASSVNSVPLWLNTSQAIVYTKERTGDSQRIRIVHSQHETMRNLSSSSPENNNF
jgi:uncharacterized membrane protein YjjP (DUF1212 family)